ncbi:MAG: hypothetical protein WBN04_14820 [Paracoccaceae bacterium]
MSRLINMVIRLVMRRGVNMGINYAARRGKNPNAMTPEDKSQARAGKEIAKKARQGARLARRIGKF